MPRRLVLPLLAIAVIAVSVPPAGAVSGSAYARPGLNRLVSLADDGSQTTAASYDPSPSADGAVVAFYSAALNLVSGPVHPNGNVYVADRAAGRTELAAATPDGSAPNGSSLQAAVSGNGRFVAFSSYATNLVPGDDADGKATQIYLRDRVAGTTERITTGLGGGAGNGGSLGAEVSVDGRYVAFFSHASNLVPDDTNARADVFMADRVAGTLRRVSVPPTGGQADGLSAYPAMSSDGRYIAFYSAATNLVPGDSNGARDIFLADTHTGAIDRVSVADDGAQGNADSFSPALSVSDDGRFVAFASSASNLVPNDTNGLGDPINGYDVFVRDRVAGTTERVSVTSAGEQMAEGYSPSMSRDGRYVAFQSIKPGEDPNSFTAKTDVFVHDRVTKATDVASLTHKHRTPGTGTSDNPRLTADGRFLVFSSEAADLVPGDSNEESDILVRDRGAEVGILTASAVQGGPGTVTVSGLATFSGEVLAAAADPADPGAPAGGDLRGASVAWRPENGDFLVRIVPSVLPAVRSGQAGVPDVGASAITYGLTFRLDGVLYELRASRVAATAPGAVAPFNLYRCTTTCARVSSPEGGYGTTGTEIRATIHLPTLGLTAGEKITDVRAFAIPGDGALPVSPLAAVDEVALDDITLPATTVTVTVGEGAGAASFTSGMSQGGWSVEVPAGAAAALSAQACRGARCDEARRVR